MPIRWTEKRQDLKSVGDVDGEGDVEVPNIGISHELSKKYGDVHDQHMKIRGLQQQKIKHHLSYQK